MERSSGDNRTARPDRGRPRASSPPSPQRGPSGADPSWPRRVGEPEPPDISLTHRLFIAIALPPAAIEEIGSFINRMPTMAGSNVRWTPKENVHLTLLFMGDTPTDRIPRIREQLDEAASNSSPFSLRLGETGAFPSLHAPRILWVGLQGEVHKLMQLQGRIEGAMRTIYFEPERRPFTPHITVGRAMRDLEHQYAGDVGFSWRRASAPSAHAEIPITEVQLIRSRFQTVGVSYEKVFGVKLGG
jgi:2'-5' RNA ligase